MKSQKKSYNTPLLAAGPFIGLIEGKLDKKKKDKKSKS
jgi:hypothetical protein